jgi:hypothetical protein
VLLSTMEGHNSVTLIVQRYVRLRAGRDTEVRGGGNINSFFHPTKQTLIPHSQPTLEMVSSLPAHPLPNAPYAFFFSVTLGTIHHS